MATAKEAAPHLKLWPENFIVSKPALEIADLTHEMKYPLDRGAPSSWVNSGDSGSSWECSNKFLRAAMVQVHAPGELEMVTTMTFLKGSILEDGIVRKMWDGQTIDGMIWMQLLAMWMLGSKALLGCTVISPHLRKPENADV